jgi:hypothetical protein
MSETAQTLIKAALRTIGAIAMGETPTADEMTEGLEALKFMLRHWSNKNIILSRKILLHSMVLHPTLSEVEEM